MSAFGDYLKSMVYGGMDGIITTFAIVCAASGANKDEATIITMGVANLLADACSMGMGDYISDKAEQDYAVVQRKKKHKLVMNEPEEQKKALVDVLVKDRGVSEADAKEIVTRVSKYDKLFADNLMQYVSGMQPPDEEDNSMMKGIVTFASFIIFGSVPLMIFLVKARIDWQPKSPLAVSTIASAITMFALGAVSGTFTEQNVLKSGLIMATQGLLAAYAAFAVGYVLESIYVEDITAAAKAAMGKSEL